jgi:curved DNA-binding protein
MGGSAAKNADSHGRIEITVEDAYHGAARTLNLRSPMVGSDGSVTMQDRALRVNVPEGVSEGQHIRLAGHCGGSFS